MYQPKLSDAPEVEFSPRILVERDGLVTYDPYFLDPDTAERAFHLLQSDIEWSQEFLKMYGRRIPFPRLTAWYGDSGAAYTYSGVRNEPHRWTPALRDLQGRLVERMGVRFNSVLLNYYRHGQDSLSWHADDEPELGDEPIIASLSLGAVREFQLKHRIDGEVVSVPLEPGSLLVMSRETQRFWCHRVPKERNVHSARINLTFRVIDAPSNTRTVISTRRK
ncbi:MAG: alpha-ketoglutarate-dependent dioxygenase AlkB [Candidatus Eremiobacteraeota bacterium]|nr:alpha-ketoglutarate-dependent dioxygenase AlkB [Candidatus Eremiobacteraeota bacterium]